MSHCQQLQKGEGLAQSLQALEDAFKEVSHKSEANEHNLQVGRVWVFISCHFDKVFTCSHRLLLS